jgi:hypothetical protein
MAVYGYEHITIIRPPYYFAEEELDVLAHYLHSPGQTLTLEHEYNHISCSNTTFGKN